MGDSDYSENSGISSSNSTERINDGQLDRSEDFSLHSSQEGCAIDKYHDSINQSRVKTRRDANSKNRKDYQLKVYGTGVVNGSMDTHTVREDDPFPRKFTGPYWARSSSNSRMDGIQVRPYDLKARTRERSMDF